MTAITLRPTLVIAAAALLGAVAQVDARGFRMAMMPNASAVGASCNVCHTTGGGSPRNDFGLAVEALVSPGGDEVFWSSVLAALDSDGDGVPNGVELGDPDGSWQAGDTDPEGNVTHPGDAESLDPDAVVPTAVEESSWGEIKRAIEEFVE